MPVVGKRIVTDVTAEVDDVSRVYAHAKAAGYEIIYGLTNAPWGLRRGLRRFYVTDPTGKVLNILQHSSRGTPG